MNHQTPLFDGILPTFNGSDYVPRYDQERLTGQIRRIFDVMADGRWRTVRQIEDLTGDPGSSISAQLRNLRKARFGGHTVEKQIRGDRERGLYEYRVLVNR